MGKREKGEKREITLVEELRLAAKSVPEATVSEDDAKVISGKLLIAADRIEELESRGGGESGGEGVDSNALSAIGEALELMDPKGIRTPEPGSRGHMIEVFDILYAAVDGAAPPAAETEGGGDQD